MGRRIKLRDDEDEDLTFARYVKDDRKKADTVKTPQQLDMFLSRNGAVSNEIQDREYGKNLVSYNPDGTRKVEKKRVQKEVLDLRNEITASREYPREYVNKLRDDEFILQDDGKLLTSRQKENLTKREYQVRAKALLTLVRVGKVKVSRYDKGILNSLADGRYNDVVYGKEDNRGNRRFERGTLVSEYERNTAQYATRSRDPSAKARAQELTERLREANSGSIASRSRASTYSQNRFYNEMRQSA